MAGIDSFTKLMLHMNSDFSDSSASGHTPTVSGATIDTGIKKFGAGSGKFVTASSQSVAYPDHSDFDVGSGSFTIDFWGYNLANADSAVFQFYDASWASVVAYIGATNLLLFLTSNGSSWDIASAVGMGLLPGAAWVHYALVRDINTYYTFRAGLQVSTFTNSSSIYHAAGNVNIGRFRNSIGGLNYIDANIDEFRVSKGIARWTSNFTPPTSEYTSDGGIIIPRRRIEGE